MGMGTDLRPNWARAEVSKFHQNVGPRMGVVGLLSQDLCSLKNVLPLTKGLPSEHVGDIPCPCRLQRGKIKEVVDDRMKRVRTHCSENYGPNYRY